MKEMVQRQKETVNAMGITFSAKHLVFALVVLHCEWLMNHLVRNDFKVEEDNRVIETSPCEGRTGNPAPRPTQLFNRIFVVFGRST